MPANTYEGQVINIKSGYYEVELADQMIILYSKEDLNYLDGITFSGSYRLIESVSNSYAYNFQKTMNRRNIYYQIKANDLEIISKHNNLRGIIYQRISKLSQPDYYNKLLLAINNYDSQIDLSLILISAGVITQNLVRLVKRVLSQYFFDDNFYLFELLFYFILFLSFRKYGFYFYLMIRLLVKGLKISAFDRFSLAVIITVLIYPEFIFNLSFIVISLFQLLSLIKIESKKLLTPILIMIPVLLETSYKVSLVQVFLYPITKTYYSLLFILGYFDVIFKSNFSYKIFTKINFYFDGFTFSGQMPLLILFLWIILSLWILRKFRIYKFLLLLVVLIINQNQLYFYPYFSYQQLYVGQGDAALLTYPFKNQVTLIDTGSSFNQAKLQSALNYYGVKKIKNLIISHDDEDHSGNLDFLSEKYQVENLIDQAGRYYFYDLEFDIQAYPTDNANDSSLITYFSINEIGYLLLGDVSKGIEVKYLLDNYGRNYQVLKLAHHGSETSTSDQLLDHEQLSLILNSSGLNNIYNHPSPIILDAITAYDHLLLDTQVFGDIIIKHYGNQTYLSIGK